MKKLPFLLVAIALLTITNKISAQEATPITHPATEAETNASVSTPTVEAENSASTSQPGESETAPEGKTDAEKKEDETFEKLVGYDPKNREVVLDKKIDGEIGQVYEVFKHGLPNSYKLFNMEEKAEAIKHFEFLVSCSQN